MKNKKDKPEWTFLSNHAHVLICISQNPEILLKEVAQAIGITERAVQRIIAELEDAGYVKRQRSGRQNLYHVKKELPLRHQIESHCKVGGLIAMIVDGKKDKR